MSYHSRDPDAEEKIVFRLKDGPLELEPDEDKRQLPPGDDEPFQGTIIDGRYKLHESIGKGAMASVYQGEHIATGRLVAIKILSEAGDDESHARFKQEAKAILSISHPHIVKAYDFGTLPTGESFLVMDFVEGTTLERIIDDKIPLPTSEIVNIAVQVASGLAEAHRCSVLHRDVKPSNIMLIGSPGNFFAKIVDFGLAKPTSSKEELRLTKTGTFVGTPLYMSPEQCSGMEVDERSDLYALGCVLYELVTGEPPFLADNRLRLLHMHINDRPRSVKEVTGTSANAVLEGVILKLLEKDKARRFQNANELISALEQWQQEKNILQIVAEQSKSGVKGLAHFSRWGVLGMIGMFALIGLPMAVIIGYGSFVQIDTPAWQVEYKMGIAQMQQGSGNLGAAKMHFRKALQLAEIAHAPDRDIENILYSQGTADNATNNYAHARTSMERGLTLSRKHEANLQRAGFLEVLNNCDLESGNLSQAILEANEAVAITRHLYGSNSQFTANALQHVAKSNWRQGQYKSAEKANRELLDIDLELHPDRQFEQIAEAYTERADIMDALGDSTEAIAAARAGLDIYKELEGKVGPNTQHTARWLTKYLLDHDKTEAQKVAHEYNIDMQKIENEVSK